MELVEARSKVNKQGSEVHVRAGLAAPSESSRICLAKAAGTGEDFSSGEVDFSS